MRAPPSRDDDRKRAREIADRYCYRSGAPRPRVTPDEDMARILGERDLLERIVRNLRKNVPKSKTWLNDEIDRLEVILARDHACLPRRMAAAAKKEEDPPF